MTHIHKERIESPYGSEFVKSYCEICGVFMKEYRASDPYLTPKAALEKVLRA